MATCKVGLCLSRFYEVHHLVQRNRRENLTDACRRGYGRTMNGRRLLPLLLAAVVFILQSGDCLGAIVSSKQSHDCCRKAHCTRQNPDPCCKVASTISIQQDQVKEKAVLPALAFVSMLQAWTVPTVSPSVDLLLTGKSLFAPSPPGLSGSFSLPLLV